MAILLNSNSLVLSSKGLVIGREERSWRQQRIGGSRIRMKKF
jgi:hypothetical protein